MKIKFILLVIVLTLALVLLSGCAKDIDAGKYAIISLPNGDFIEGEIECITIWTASMCEVKIDGVTYFAHPSCVALIEKNE